MITFLQDNIIEFEEVFVDPDNNDVVIDPAVVTFQFWFSSDSCEPATAFGEVLTYTGSSTPAVNTVFRIQNEDGDWCYRCRIDTTSLNIVGDYGMGVGKWKSTGNGQAADNQYALIKAN
jgi:hypothetical protein